VVSCITPLLTPEGSEGFSDARRPTTPEGSQHDGAATPPGLRGRFYMRTVSGGIAALNPRLQRQTESRPRQGSQRWATDTRWHPYRGADIVCVPFPGVSLRSTPG